MLEKIVYRAGQLVGILLAALAALLVVALLVTMGRVVYWLIVEHPIIAAGSALAGGTAALLSNRHRL